MDIVLINISFVVLKYLFSMSSICVLLSVQTIYSVFCSILAFVFAAGLMIMGGAVSVGSVLIVVYVGSVLISSLFVTMMLDLRAELKFNFVNFSAICFVLMLTLLIDVTSIIVSDTIPTNFEFVRVLYSQPNIVVIGYILYTWYVVPLILCAFIPLVAMMGTIVLLLDFDSLNIGESGRLAYSQNISLQVATHDFAAMELRSPLISYPTSVARYRLSRVSQRY